MKITLLTVGRSTNSHVARLVDHFALRVGRYIDYAVEAVPDVKTTRTTTEEKQREMEGRNILSALRPGDFLWLLDEHGTEYTSREFAREIQRRMAAGVTKRIVFVVGGPYGFSPDVKERSDALISLSRMTFPHEMVPLLFTEQVYRAMTILRGEPYHHD